MSAASADSWKTLFEEIEAPYMQSSNGAFEVDLEAYELITNQTLNHTADVEVADAAPSHGFDTFDVVVHGFLLLIVGNLGLLGNVVSIVVLSRPQMKSSINTILIGLVSCDSILIVTSIFMFGLRAFQYTQTGFFR